VIRIVYYELVKTFLKKRTYLGFGLVLLIVPLVEVAFKLEGGRFINIATRGLARDFFMIGNLFNGWFVSHQIMNSLWFHIPLLISFVAGDQLAGEATGGTYRLILIRPASRTKIFFAKYVTTLLYTVSFVFFLAGLSIGLAVVLLGRGDLILITRTIVILPASEVAWRFLVAYVFALWAMVTIASLSFFFSAFVENAIGPIVATMGVLIIFSVISVIPLQMLESVKPFLFTSSMNLWQEAFYEPMNWKNIWEGLTCFGVYSIVSVLGAWAIFVKKDILS
jgi:ABC-2 type transport system permease protein